VPEAEAAAPVSVAFSVTLAQGLESTGWHAGSPSAGASLARNTAPADPRGFPVTPRDADDPPHAIVAPAADFG